MDRHSASAANAAYFPPSTDRPAEKPLAGTGDLTLPLPDFAAEALRVIEQAGFEGWCVGGFVRDALIGRPLHDVDIACSAHWTQTQAAFEQAGYTTHETGTAHGTLTVVVDGHAIEVTTYRTDGAYSDGRHPEQVSFVQSIEEDLARRDFTINAMAYHPTRGICDPFDGLSDIEAHIIRTVGDPLDRVREDHLRILRACRLASELGFSIERETYKRMKRAKTLMLDLPAERIRHELERLLLGEYVHDALIGTVDVLAGVLPELIAMKGFDQHTPYHIYDVLEHTAYVVHYAPATPLARWTALLHDIGKPAAFFQEEGRGHFFGHARLSVIIAKPILERLKFSPLLQENILLLIKMHDVAIEPTTAGVKRALHRHFNDDVPLFETLCAIKRADTAAQAPRCSNRAEIARQLSAVLAEVLENDQAFSLSQLAIDGSDVMRTCALGPGPAVGALLDAALDAVIEGRVPNEREALREFVRNNAQQSATP